MIEQGITFYFIFVLFLLLLLVLSIIIPFYGYLRKRWKGLAIGCLVQPIIIGAIFFLAIIGISYFHVHELSKQRDAAMVTISKSDTTGIVHFWYLKTNEECFYEYKEKENEENEYKGFNRGRFYDVVPLDSCSVGVDDKIVVKFDFKTKKVTATEYEEPMEVVNVNWERVTEFFRNLPKHKNPE